MLFNTVIVTLAIAITAAAAPAEALWGDGRVDQLKRSPSPAEALWGDGRVDQLKRSPAPANALWGDGRMDQLKRSAAPAEALWGDGRVDQLKRSPSPAKAVWGDGRVDQLKRTVGHGLPTRFSPLCGGVSSGESLKRCLSERRNEDELVGRTDSKLAVE